MQNPPPTPVTLKWVGAAAGVTQDNDGFNCKAAADPFLPAEEDPEKCPALGSCLWEVDSLRQHCDA